MTAQPLLKIEKGIITEKLAELPGWLTPMIKFRVKRKAPGLYHLETGISG